MRRLCLALFFSFLSIPSALAALASRTVDYKVGDKTYKGYLVWDDAVAGKRPGVVVFHEWWGLNDYTKSRADQLAKAGYVAFAADLYGGGKIAAHPDEAGAMVTEAKSNAQEWLARANAALATLGAQATVTPGQVAAIGYCFGGATALQLAYSGVPLKLVATFHGALSVPEHPENIKAKLLIFHGGKDPFASPETIQQLKAALDRAKVDYQFVVYPEAMHGFTVPGSENRGVKGLAYNAEADQKSWQQLLTTLSQVFTK